MYKYVLKSSAPLRVTLWTHKFIFRKYWSPILASVDSVQSFVIVIPAAVRLRHMIDDVAVRRSYRRRRWCRHRCRHNHNRWFLDGVRISAVRQQRQQRCCAARLRLLLALQLFRALLLEEHAHIVDGEDDALAGRLLCIDVDAAHQHRIGAVEQREE